MSSSLEEEILETKTENLISKSNLKTKSFIYKSFR